MEPEHHGFLFPGTSFFSFHVEWTIWGVTYHFFYFMEGMEFSKQPTKISGEDSAFTMEYVPPTFREAPDGNGF